MMGSLQLSFKIIREWHAQVLQLCRKPRKQISRTPFRVVHSGLIAIVPQMPSGDQTVSAIVSRSTGNENLSAFTGWMNAVDCDRVN